MIFIITVSRERFLPALACLLTLPICKCRCFYVACVLFFYAVCVVWSSILWLCVCVCVYVCVCVCAYLLMCMFVGEICVKALSVSLLPFSPLTSPHPPLLPPVGCHSIPASLVPFPTPSAMCLTWHTCKFLWVCVCVYVLLFSLSLSPSHSRLCFPEYVLSLS